MRWFVLVVLGLGLVIPTAGCRARSTPPGADAMSASDLEMSFLSLRWKEGLRLLFVDDLKGEHASRGSGSTESPIHTVVGSAGPANGARCAWKLETQDGKSAKLTINGKDYDLSQGTLFVIKASGDEIDVHQLKRDLSTIPLEVESCLVQLKKDAEITKILGIGNAAE